MNILVACEESQRVCKAFRDKGHNAYSCDIIPTSGSNPEWHIEADVVPLLNGNCTFTTGDGVEHTINGKWDMIIAFPPCTYLTACGAARLYPKKGQMDMERYQKGVEARDFFMKIWNADCDKICIENPLPLRVFNLPPKTQIIQPYEHGEPYSKRTLLWLKGLPKLVPTEIITEGIVSWVNGGSKTASGERRKNVGVKHSAKERSKTFWGIARAMAAQWGGD